MKITELKNYLTSKCPGFNYTYIINDVKYSINEINNRKGWSIDIYIKNDNEWSLVESCGHDGFRLRDCKDMILWEVKYTSIIKELN